MADYQMLKEGDRVLVAVSGGIDSLVLCCLLQKWLQKAPISFSLTAIHIDHGFWVGQKEAADPRIEIGSQLQRHGIELVVIPERKIDSTTRTCFFCAKNRREQLFDLARFKGFTTIALGHHKDDLIETFLLNAMYAGNISTMLPHQKLFNKTLSIVRPMAYLAKDEVHELGEIYNLVPVKNFCKLAENTNREKVRTLLKGLYHEDPGIRQSLFAALKNVRSDYLL